ncbi:DUF885 domain-containing protein [Eleftheria terrae]|uniref:DUF885 domain-containing protein n=1 Tax=Eleftheria terrae TaxID=1597781 RepID=UPI00263BDC38|nr:DUF885 domain-containing protein [Eleftheria terrae]WKB52188.1 DUF885 domain-containing protein [Eleftheria terrae]
MAAIVGGCATRPAPGNSPAVPALERLMQEHWEWTMQIDPEWATSVGDHRYDDRLADRSLPALQRQLEGTRDYIRRLKAEVPREQLDDARKVSYDVFLHHLEDSEQSLGFPATGTMVLSNKAGVHLEFPQLVLNMPFRTEQDYRNYLARLRALPAAIERDIGAMRHGMGIGWVTFRSSMEKVPAQIDTLVAADAEHSPLYQPFKDLPKELTAAQRDALAREARQVIEQQVRPAFARLKAFVQQDYLPRSPVEGGMSHYPGGPEYYRFMVRSQTTTDMEPQQIHELGLSEVARLRGEMEKLMLSTEFKGTFPQFVDWMNTQPRFLLNSPEALLARYRDIAKRVDAELPKLFAELPRMPYGIRAQPEHEGPESPEYYSPGTADGSRAGWFNANVMALERRPTWEMEALFLHEAVPGHHLQNARALELSQLPMLRRANWYVAYGEGWALYAETLGSSLGLYTDPYARFGQLRMEIYRAARLVVDTGIHAFGWSRAKAISWMTERTGMREEEVAAEVDRYFVWPGQALGYKIGQLHIAGLRNRMQRELGECFDIRRFHNAVLDEGALPLSVLDRWMDRWLAAERSSRAGCPRPLATAAAS